MSAPINAREMIQHGAAMLSAISREPRRDAALLLGRVLARDRAWLLGHPETDVTDAEQIQYERFLARRTLAEPIQYILGEQEFYGLRFAVSPAVLIPRPETEHLVEVILEKLPRDRAVRIVDVGTGSGAIAVTLAHLLPLAQVDAVDVSPAALDVARENARALGVAERERCHESDLLAAVCGERYDVVAANPPYVPSGEQLETQVMAWEPHDALFAGEQGMAIYRRLVPEARRILRPGGLLAMEIGAGQAELLRSLLAEDAYWGEPIFARDLQGIERVVMAERRTTIYEGSARS